MEKESYKAKVWCHNCGLNREIELRKGVRVEDGECPDCGCIGLKRVEDPVIIEPRHESYI
jgi:ssDNA-binding Zn-finger/Zn-ribbon topoisomerase 1